MASHELLWAIAEPGCVFCRAQDRSVRNFFFWYAAESYSEPEVIERVRQSMGFCRRHTRQLLREASPATIGWIYEQVLELRLDALRSFRSARAPAGSWQRLLVHLQPTRACPACDDEEWTLAWWMRLLKLGLADDEVRLALERREVMCVRHFLAVASGFGWSELRLLARALLQRLSEADGQDLCHGFVPECRAGGAGPGVAPPADGSRRPDHRRERAGWSPVLAQLQELIAQPGCPLCRGCQNGFNQYVQWLVNEAHRPQPSADSVGRAIWLCPIHTSAVFQRADAETVATLARARAGYWRGQLAQLVQALKAEPPRGLLGRLRQTGGWSRRRGAEDGGSSPVQGFVRVLRSPERQLADILPGFLRETECPVCFHFSTVRNRLADLLARALEDRDIRRQYCRSSGVCLQDLPLLISACRTDRQREVVTEVALVRLEVLQWELQEAMRKLNWTVRYEPKGPEQLAWRRAIEQVTGDLALA